MMRTSPSADITPILERLIQPELCPNKSIYERVRIRLKEGAFTRTENPRSHFCVYFFPVNRQTKQIFMIHHKKSNLWLSPGGHMDPSETPHETLNREIEEELGVKTFFKETPIPFQFFIVDIENKIQPCKAHHDLWYTMETDGSDFKVDPAEFYDAKWMTIEEARKIVTDPSNLLALQKIEARWQ
jgi:8-oxo-dGTP diphosphatase